jgi:hypothetical protein
VLHLQLIILSVIGDVPVDYETLLMIDFMNLKIKLIRFFKCVHMGRVYAYVFIELRARTCTSICVCTVFSKKSICCISCLFSNKINHNKYIIFY